MPITIYSPKPDVPEKVAWLCSGKWRLPDQADALEAWLIENHTTLKPGNYVADIAFSPREDAMGGGAAISPQMLRTMADLGMSRFLSEYPSIKNEP